MEIVLSEVSLTLLLGAVVTMTLTCVRIFSGKAAEEDGAKEVREGACRGDASRVRFPKNRSFVPIATKAQLTINGCLMIPFIRVF